MKVRFKVEEPEGHRPRFSFIRYGQTFTRVVREYAPELLIYIGGIHYDEDDDTGGPDEFIYNDVVFRELDGSVEIFGYPRDHFPPTDYHSSTLADGKIYVIGGHGYEEDRILGTTPVYQLDLRNMLFTRLPVTGPEPGWIFGHGAVFVPGLQSIAVYGGRLIDLEGHPNPNKVSWLFNLRTHTWSEIESLDPRQL